MNKKDDKNKINSIFGIRPIIEAIHAGKTIDKLFIQKGLHNDLFTELLQFPNAAHDDQVDAMTMAIHYMKESWRLTHPDDPEFEDEIKDKKRVAYWRV